MFFYWPSDMVNITTTIMFVLIVTVLKINNIYPITPMRICYIDLKISSTTNTIILIGVPTNIDKII